MWQADRNTARLKWKITVVQAKASKFYNKVTSTTDAIFCCNFVKVKEYVCECPAGHVRSH